MLSEIRCRWATTATLPPSASNSASRLLRDRPLPTSLDPCDDLDLGHQCLLLELQKEARDETKVSYCGRRRYTCQTGRLRLDRDFARRVSSDLGLNEPAVAGVE